MLPGTANVKSISRLGGQAFSPDREQEAQPPTPIIHSALKAESSHCPCGVLTTDHIWRGPPAPPLAIGECTQHVPPCCPSCRDVTPGHLETVTLEGRVLSLPRPRVPGCPPYRRGLVLRHRSGRHGDIPGFSSGSPCWEFYRKQRGDTKQCVLSGSQAAVSHLRHQIPAR